MVQDKMAKRLRVAVYCRFKAGGDEQFNSGNLQTEHYARYIQSKPEWEFAGVYADEGAGKRKPKRKRFKEMIRDALGGKIDIIIVKSVTRFSRDARELLTTVRELKEKGVRVIFEMQGIDTADPRHDSILSIFADVMEDENRAVSKNIKWRVS